MKLYTIVFLGIILPKIVLGALEDLPIDQYGRSVKECTENCYLADSSLIPTRVITRDPLPANLVLGDSFGTRRRSYVTMTPVSEVHSDYASMPSIGNHSIFDYLESSRSDNFSRFVRTYYKSSCAILYDSYRGPKKIIGTGTFIDGSTWRWSGEGIVATARHITEGLTPGQLWVRFFHYDVKLSSRRPGKLIVTEHHMDVPVIEKYSAWGGLDAGVLRLIPVSDENQKKYMQRIPISLTRRNSLVSSLPPGKFVMFHFAGTPHQVSIGHVYRPSRGAYLHDNVGIEAGSGASGAAILHQGLSRPTALGINIYRITSRTDVQRRVIPFSRFTNPEGINNRISAPYLYDPRFRVIPPEAYNRDGYEFLQWQFPGHLRRVDTLGGALYRDKVYGVLPNHSKHHIIPIPDLLYLWNYLNEDGDLNPIPPDGGGRYYQFRETIKGLSPLWFDAYGKLGFVARLESRVSTLRRQFDRTYFAWSWWNLFKGWNSDYRQDDPSDHLEDSPDRFIGSDTSEKKKPLSFDSDLWDHVKNLGKIVRELKRLPGRKDLTERRLLKALISLKEWWMSKHKVTINPRGSITIEYPPVHNYNPGDWEGVGYREGHRVYKLK